jgi:hypothetical protein
MSIDMDECKKHTHNTNQLYSFPAPKKLGVLFSLHQCVRAQCSFRFPGAFSLIRSLTFGRWGCGEHDHLNHAVSRTIAGLKGENRGKPAAQKDAEKALLSDKAIFRFSSFEWFE